ncbi:hypothetical protein [Nonomuraea sp. NPDC049646]|uniref:hypothetical protein n=1 Tax=unclassified Nonomuraea TaxID=2593643 RepID=UPI0037B6F217
MALQHENHHEARAARTRAAELMAALGRHGVKAEPDGCYLPVALVLTFEEADKVIGLLTASPDSPQEG